MIISVESCIKSILMGRSLPPGGAAKRKQKCQKHMKNEELAVTLFRSMVKLKFLCGSKGHVHKGSAFLHFFVS